MTWYMLVTICCCALAINTLDVYGQETPAEDICSLPKDVGKGRAKLNRFYYDASVGECMPFIFGGGKGNANNFKTLEECQQACPEKNSPIEKPEKPEQPTVAPTPEKTEPTTVSPVPEKTEQPTMAPTPQKPEKPEQPTVAPTPEKPEQPTNSSKPEKPLNKICKLPLDKGKGNATLPRFYYNFTRGRCELFIFKGGEGNANNFKSMLGCIAKCIFANILSKFPKFPNFPKLPKTEKPEKPEAPEKPEKPEAPEKPEKPEAPEKPEKPEVPKIPEKPEKPETPKLPEKPIEPLKRQMPKFPTKPKMPKMPKFPGKPQKPEMPKFPEKPEKPEKPEMPKLPEKPEKPEKPEMPKLPEKPQKPEMPKFPEKPEKPEKPEMPKLPEKPEKPEMPKLPEKPQKPEMPKLPEQPQKPEMPKPEKPEKPEMPKLSEKPGNLPGKPALPSKPENRESDVCSLPKVVGRGRARIPRFFFDSQSGECVMFIFGGGKGNGNNFKSKEECEEKCANDEKPTLPPKPENPESDVCSLPKVVGRGRARIPRFFFDSQSGECVMFIFGGGKGNGNNFKSKEECEEKCANDEKPTLPPKPENPISDVCSLPKVVGRGRARIPRFFFDSQSGECVMFIFGGGKGNGNNFKSKEECEEKCANEECK